MKQKCYKFNKPNKRKVERFYFLLYILTSIILPIRDMGNWFLIDQ